MSTTDTGISGSSTSRSADQRRSVTFRACIGGLRGGRLPATLERGDILVVHRAAALPAHQHLVPADLPFFERPALFSGIEARGERHLEHVRIAFAMGRY